MKKLFLLLMTVMLAVGSAMAQKTVSGTVVYAGDNEPLAGATVMPVGGGTGTATDLDGKFTLTVPEKVSKLTVSYVGMINQTVAITDKPLVIKMSDSENNLDEVMVVAYGTAKRSAFTGSASVVKAEQIEQAQVTNVLDALSGRVTQVQVAQSSGQPGVSSPTLRVGGISSINAGKDPLVIIDGAPFNGDMNTLNTNDIASMTVLKDAASTALYGARAANGVILITTKSGQRSSEGRVTVDLKWGVNTRAQQDYDYIKSPAQYYEMYHQSLYNYAYTSVESAMGDPRAAYRWAANNMFSADYGLGYNVYTVPAGQYLVGYNGKLNPNATLGRRVSFDGIDYWLTPDSWLDESYKHGLRQEYNVSFQSGNESSSMYASFNYLDTEGITKNSDFKRLTAFLAAESQVKPWLKVSASANYSHYSSNSLTSEGDSSSSGNIFAAATQVAPIYPLYLRNADGSIMVDSNGITRYDYGNAEILGFERPVYTNTNAVDESILNTNYTNGNAFYGKGSVEIRFLKDFKFISNNSFALDEYRSNYVGNPYYGQNAGAGGYVNVGHGRTLQWQYQQMLTWNRSFGKNNFGLTLVHENSWRNTWSLSGTKTNMFDANNHELAGAINSTSQSSSTGQYNNEGWLGRLEYDFDETYFGSVFYRRDGSSRFHPKHRWGSFWGVGAAWIISKEKWFNAKFVDMLKIRASYGEVGNDQIGSYLYTNTYDIVNSAGNPAAVPVNMGNEEITWEKLGSLFAGVEFSLFNERLSGNFEYFYKKTSDMLFFFPLPPSFGYTGYYDNIGDMTNNGISMELNGTVFRTRDFRWDINLNLTHYKNKIKSLPEERKTMVIDGAGGFSSGDYFYGEGLPMYTFYMKKFAGVDKNTGEALYYYKDKDGNMQTTPNYNQADQFTCGNPFPDLFGGFGTTVQFKGFDLSLNFNYQIGGKVFDSGYRSLMAVPYSTIRGQNFHADLLNAWSETNRNSNIPRLQFGDQYTGQTSDRWLTDASYLNLQNINFGYTLPTSLSKKACLNKVRLYVSAENVWLWSKRQGLDPRQSVSGGSNATMYSPIRTISGGINVTF